MRGKTPAGGAAGGNAEYHRKNGTAARSHQELDAASIARALGGRRCGAGWKARCPAHDDRAPSLAIHEGRDGRVLVHCFAGCPQQSVIDALRRRGLWPDRSGGGVPDPLARLRARRVAADAARREEAKRIAAARRIWHAAQPIRPGDVVDHYLRHRLAGLRPPSGWPPTLRTGRDRHGPLLVAAAARWPGREVVAVQVTRLTADGRKRPVEPVRITRGVLRGAAVRLGPWVPGRPLVLVEGIEDGIAVLAAWPEAAVWALLGATNAARVVLPGRAEVVLALDGDAAGRRAAEEAAKTLTRNGRRVRLVRLPDGTDPAVLLATSGREEARPVAEGGPLVLS